MVRSFLKHTINRIYLCQGHPKNEWPTSRRTGARKEEKAPESGSFLITQGKGNVVKKLLLVIGVVVAVGFGLAITTTSPSEAANAPGWHSLGPCGAASNSNGWCAWSCVMHGHSGNGAHCCVRRNAPDLCYCY